MLLLPLLLPPDLVLPLVLVVEGVSGAAAAAALETVGALAGAAAAFGIRSSEAIFSLSYFLVRESSLLLRRLVCRCYNTTTFEETVLVRDEE